MGAVVTLLEMAAENSSPADLDRGQNAALRRRKRSAMFLTIGFAVVAKHICHLKLGVERRLCTSKLGPCRSVPDEHHRL
jgi:hypothetical protein